ncbi:sugar transferase [Peribacillus sp. NPDC096448]|uniref:sugar transferase n=1 Tax=Peribacillus sp. NPDC096448 TaxID=3364395 RepID=UPI003818DADA
MNNEQKGILDKNSYLNLKRITDLFFSILLLILVSPIMFLACVAIKVESNGPAIFKQQRPGKDAKVFRVFKFRTMRVETEKDGKALSDMERMTRIGSLLRKTSIDELPQLINILRGEMSFIGPRPLLVKYLEYYSEEQMRRHEVTPGISGWAQVNGRNTISWEEKFKFDNWYVDNISLSLDLKILWLTIYNVLKRKDINNSQGDTMPYFTRDTNKN